MGLVIAGIDEAGYGPLLGPLCVGMAVVRLETAPATDGPVDLWKVLRSGVCRAGGDRRRRVAVADSKKLKLANGVKTGHPLSQLERGVLAFMASADAQGRAAETDVGLLEALGCAAPGQRWYAGDAFAIPLAWTPDQIRIATNMLKGAMTPAGVGGIELACRVVCEETFNRTVRDAGSKARATENAIQELLGRLLRSAVVREDDVVWVVCDRLGGRMHYAETVQQLVPGCEVSVVEESERQSRYAVGAGARRLTMSFEVEGEDAHLPVALASMTAKLVRELMMMRFNRYWCGVEPKLKPTAGYRGDAWRWLEDAEGILTPDDRRMMIRIA